jgi:SOS response regulatory protein OraA/RecX
VFYSLSYEDIQNIAEEDLGRELTENEIESVVDEISERIDWTTAISDVLLDKFQSATEKPKKARKAK